MNKKLQKYLKEKRLKDLYEKVKAKYEEKSPIAHNWEHTYRDLINSIIIGEAEKADMSIVLPSVILHDIGFLTNPNPSVHHIEGSEKCLGWLDDWSKEEQTKISECIKRHKGKAREFAFEPTTIEEKVVHDADVLEKYGKIGIAQGVKVFTEFAETAKPEFKSLKKMAEFLSQIKERKLCTKTAQKMAEERGGFISPEFFQSLLEELEMYSE